MKLLDGIKGYILDCKIAPQTASHIHQKDQRLKHFVKWVEKQQVELIEDVTANLIKAYIVFLQEHIMGDDDGEKRASYKGKKFAPLSIAGYVRVVRSFFNWCEREELLDGHGNPAKKLPRIKIPKYIIPAFKPEQLRAMLDVCNTSTSLGYRNYTILLLFADTGIRVAELAGLKVQNIHDDFITVFGKYSKEREVGITPTTIRALWKYIHHYRKHLKEQEQHVFLSFSGNPLNPKSLWHILRTIGNEASIEGVRVSPHTLRHTFSKEWLSSGGDIYSLSLVLGHNDMRTTTNYLKDFKSTEARAQHIKRSPVENWHLGKKSRKKKKGDSD